MRSSEKKKMWRYVRLNRIFNSIVTLPDVCSKMELMPPKSDRILKLIDRQDSAARLWLEQQGNIKDQYFSAIHWCFPVFTLCTSIRNLCIFALFVHILLFKYICLYFSVPCRMRNCCCSSEWAFKHPTSVCWLNLFIYAQFL